MGVEEGGGGVVCVWRGGETERTDISYTFFLLFFLDLKNDNLAGGLIACLDGLQGKLDLN